MINNKNYQQNDQQKNPINIKNQHLLTTTNINKDYQQEINKKNNNSNNDIQEIHRRQGEIY